jgi:hypothetical protein
LSVVVVAVVLACALIVVVVLVKADYGTEVVPVAVPHLLVDTQSLVTWQYDLSSCCSQVCIYYYYYYEVKVVGDRLVVVPDDFAPKMGVGFAAVAVEASLLLHHLHEDHHAWVPCCYC